MMVEWLKPGKESTYLDSVHKSVTGFKMCLFFYPGTFALKLPDLYVVKLPIWLYIQLLNLLDFSSLRGFEEKIKY